MDNERINEMLDDIYNNVLQIDDFFASNDINNATKKTHECLLLIKAWKDILNEPVAS